MAASVSSYPFLFEPTTLSTIVTSLYLVPASPTSTILKNAVLYFNNYSGAAQTITLNCVPPAGSVGADNQFCTTLTVNPSTAPIAVPLPDMLGGSTIQALASANTCINVFAKGGALFV